MSIQQWNKTQWRTREGFSLWFWLFPWAELPQGWRKAGRKSPQALGVEKSALLGCSAPDPAAKIPPRLQEYRCHQDPSVEPILKPCCANLWFSGESVGKESSVRNPSQTCWFWLVVPFLYSKCCWSFGIFYFKSRKWEKNELYWEDFHSLLWLNGSELCITLNPPAPCFADSKTYLIVMPNSKNWTWL